MAPRDAGLCWRTRGALLSTRAVTGAGSHAMPLDQFCANCGEELATIASAALCFDQLGNSFCCDDCRQTALAALWELLDELAEERRAA